MAAGRVGGGGEVLDLGVVRAVLEADAPRVRCVSHGVVVAAVPWARHGAGHTRYFDDQVAWLAVACSKSAVTALMRIAWRTVGAIVTRVAAEAAVGVDRFAGLHRIGIDEISYKKGAPVLDRGGRSPQPQADLGRARARQGHLATVLRSAR
jgi:transposase